MKGTLFLVPLHLAENTAQKIVTDYNLSIIHSLTIVIAENARTARRFMREISYPAPLETVTVFELSKDNPTENLSIYIKPLLEGENIGLMSEAGCPGVADPGSEVVALAHKNGIKVVPLVGPSSLLLALMASGLNGQKFCFHGYIPVDKAERGKTIKKLESESRNNNQTQIFIETPYRNNPMVESLLENLHQNTKLCIAQNITSETETIYTKTIAEWKKNIPKIEKVPVVFLFLA
jgi:16S rRNA (cytidine1402-2'-O)-methyltransferase